MIHEPHPTATATTAGTIYIKLAPRNSWVGRGHTLGHQIHPTAKPHTAGTNHIKLAPRNSWVPITSNCHDHTLRQPITPDCHNHTREHKPHPTGATNLVGTNLIQLSCHTLRDQTHPTATATHAGTNHIQLAPPNSWPPIISNCHRQIHGYQSHPIIIVTHVGTKHI